MISDTERREVARKLREDAANDKLREQVFVEEIIAGCIGETMHDEWGNVREVEILTRLADLIDRPKAKREDAGNYWRCGHCGAFSRKDAVTNCFGVIPSRCCGNCGREWER